MKNIPQKWQFGIASYVCISFSKQLFPRPWECGSRFGCLIPGVAINIADGRAVLPSEPELALLNNMSLETRQVENVGAHGSVLCSGDALAGQLLVCSVPGFRGGFPCPLPGHCEHAEQCEAHIPALKCGSSVECTAAVAGLGFAEALHRWEVV